MGEIVEGGRFHNQTGDSRSINICSHNDLSRRSGSESDDCIEEKDCVCNT